MKTQILSIAIIAVSGCSNSELEELEAENRELETLLADKKRNSDAKARNVELKKGLLKFAVAGTYMDKDGYHKMIFHENGKIEKFRTTFNGKTYKWKINEIENWAIIGDEIHVSSYGLAPPVAGAKRLLRSGEVYFRNQKGNLVLKAQIDIPLSGRYEKNISFGSGPYQALGRHSIPMENMKEWIREDETAPERVIWHKKKPFLSLLTMGGKLTAGHLKLIGAYEYRVNSEVGRMVLLANGLVEEWEGDAEPKLMNLCRDDLPKWKLIGEEIHVYRKAEIDGDVTTIFKITPTGNLFFIGLLHKGARILKDELNRSDPSNPIPDLIYKRIP